MKPHDTSSRASALLRRASPGFEPSSRDRAQTRAAIRRRLAVGIAAGVAASASAKTAAAAPSIAPAAVAGAGAVTAGTAASSTIAAGAGVGFATKIIAAVAILGTVSAGAVTVHRASHVSQTPTVAATATATKTETTTEAKTESPSPVAVSNVDLNVAPSAIELPKADVRPTTIEPRPTIIDQQPSPLAPSLQIGAEVDLLERAQEALRAGDADRALALLDEHARTYPNGALGEERDAARVLALCGAGRVDEARALADSFSSAHPTSPFSARVHESCASRPLTP